MKLIFEKFHIFGTAFNMENKSSVNSICRIIENILAIQGELTFVNTYVNTV